MKKESKSELKIKLENFWKWLWHSESIWSYIVLILLIIIIVKLIFFPILSLIFGTSLPLAIVESSSMDHQIIKDDLNRFSLCGEIYEEKTRLDFNQYWDLCGDWYETNTNITKQDMQEYTFSNGFKKSDLMIISGHKEPEIGDVIIFQTNRAHPLIHRVISLDPLSTKGDHNSKQLPEEENISGNQVIGIAIGRIPYIGWPKVKLCENFKIPIICA